MRRGPDFDNLRRTLLREGPPGPVPLIELFADPGMVQAVLSEPLSWESVIQGSGLDTLVRFCLEAGYDYVWSWTGLNFPRANFQVAADTAGAENWSGGARIWQDESTGPIQSLADFEAYPWPKPDHISYRALEYLASAVPEGMKISVNVGGIFENASWLMGLERFSYALFDQPDLISALFQRVGDLTATAVSNALSIDGTGMCFLGDDLGYASGTVVSPEVLREHVFPQYRRLTQIAHRAGKPILLHSCGNLERVMDEIAGLGFAAKHSFEDKIMPVEEVHRRWGDRVAVLGGVDMDLLTRGSEREVRRRARQILEVCAARGTGYCLGTGNSAANYLPVENYLAMLDEGRRWNREHFSGA